MTRVVPFALVLGFLFLLLAVAVFLLWRKRRNARVEAAAFAESLAARERRREARSKKTGLLTRREIESIAPESIHAPPPNGEEEAGSDGGACIDRGGGGLGARAEKAGMLVGASGSITSSSLDGDGEELRGARGGGGAGSSAPQVESMETPFPSKVDPNSAGDYTEADNRGDADARADEHPDATSGDRGRRPEGAGKRPGADYIPGSTLTCAICLGTLSSGGRVCVGWGRGVGAEVVTDKDGSMAGKCQRLFPFLPRVFLAVV